MIWMFLAVALSAGYRCEGTTDGKAYVLPLMVETQGENYVFYWLGSDMAGLGIKKDDNVSVAIINTETKGMGVAYYKASKGKLDGTWSPGDGKVYKEVCTEATITIIPGQQSVPVKKEKTYVASK